MNSPLQMITTAEKMIQNSDLKGRKVEKLSYQNGLTDENPILKSRSIELEVICDVDSSMDSSSSDLESESDSERISEVDILEEEKDAGASGPSSCQKSANRES